MGQFHVRRRNAINVTSRLEYIPGVRFAWSSMADSCVCTLSGGIASMETVYTIYVKVSYYCCTFHVCHKKEL